MNNDRLKFRVWDKKTNKYIESCINIDEYFCPAITCDGEIFFSVNRYGEFNIEKDQSRFIIEQCTGLKDKNGNLIYEGDLIEDEDKITYEIFWNNEASRFVAGRNGDDNRYNKGVLLWGDCEIISNIHENKE